MASSTCSFYTSGIKVSDLTIITPDEVQAKLLDDGSIYFELDVQLIYNAYAGVRTFGSSSCYATHETGINLSFQIGAGITCNVTFTQGSDTYIKTPVKDKLYAYFGGSDENPPPSKSVVTSGKWIVKIGGSSASAVKSMCLSQDSKGAFFWFRLQNYSKAWAKMWANYGYYLSSSSVDLCYRQNKDIYIKVYIPFAVKIESIYFKPSNTVNAGTEVEVWAKLTNLTGKPFDGVFRFSGVSRNAKAKVFDVKTALHIEIGTNDYMIGKVKYTAEDELVIYLEATPKSLFVKDNISGESQVCYWEVVGSMKCITISAVRKGEVVVEGVRVEPTTVVQGQLVTVYAKVSNPGSTQATGTITLRVLLDGKEHLPTSEMNITLNPGETKEIAFNPNPLQYTEYKIGMLKVGTYQICINDKCTTIEVKPAPLEVKNEDIVVDPEKDTYLEGETITIWYRVGFNIPVNFELILTVNDSVIARKTATDTVGESISTKWTIPKAGKYKICGDYRLH